MNARAALAGQLLVTAVGIAAAVFGSAWVGSFDLPGILTSSAFATVVFPVTIGRQSVIRAWCAAAAGGCCGWLLVAHFGQLTHEQALLCTCLMASVLAAEAAWVSAFARLGRHLSAAIVIAAGLVWLSWPLWTVSAPPLLVRCHPLLAINGVVAGQLGLWTEQPVAYPLMSLGQDVAYALPQSPWFSVAVHGGIAAVGWLARMASRSTNHTDADASPKRMA